VAVGGESGLTLEQSSLADYRGGGNELQLGLGGDECLALKSHATLTVCAMPQARVLF
jgi:hypothetical protein